MKLILQTESIADLESHLPSDIDRIYIDSDGKFDRDPSDADVFFNWYYLKPHILNAVLAAAPNLRWQHTPSAGVNHILTPDYLQRDIVLTNSAGIHAVPISEFVLGYILSYAKLFPKLQQLQSQHFWNREWDEDPHSWEQDYPFQELLDATLLIIGAGNIGQAIAQRASAFGMRVWGVRRHPQLTPGFEQVVAINEWRSLLPEAKYIVVATPLTVETKGLIDQAALRSMRSDAYFINIARGAVVDEVALLQALTEGWIAGAALDTFITEPLPSDSPFWSLPNVFVTPHCSALSPHLVKRIVELFLDNVNRYRTGQPLRNVVDKQGGY
jgi:phosphoglycerate dehydrogenase-like enzyme